MSAIFSVPEWHNQAACRVISVTEIDFFPAKGATRSVRAAKLICSQCPVLSECAEAGTHERSGIWGGKSADIARRQPGARSPQIGGVL